MIFLRLNFTNLLRHRASSLISVAGIAFPVAAMLTVVTILEGAVGPKILLADEPTGSLEEKTSSMVFDLLLEVVAAASITLLMATHDRSLAKRCDRLVGCTRGRSVNTLTLDELDAPHQAARPVANAAWHRGSVIAYAIVMLIASWYEGVDPAFTIVPEIARNILYTIRLIAGIPMLIASLDWLADASTLFRRPVPTSIEVLQEETA